LLGPIFLREWITVPRRSRHYVTRSVYLVVLWILGVTAWQATVGWSRTPTLGDTSRFGPFLFQILTFVELSLLLFFAALSAASTITQEKDRRTFILLLMTDLRNYEIVLGKLLGSLLQIALLLLATIPVLMMTLLLGGVALSQVIQVVVLLAAVALASGSLGGLVALWREKTFQSLALTVLLLVLYLCVVRGMNLVPAVANLEERLHLTQFQGWLDPYQAWLSVLSGEQSQAIAPAYGFGLMMLFLSGLLNLLAIARLRVWNPSGEPIMQRERPEDAEAEEKDRAKAHAAPGEQRAVWDNPILWREIRTRAYGRRPLLVKLSFFLVLGLICYYALSPLWSGADRPAFAAAVGLVPVGILSLLLISAQAVTAITSERDTGALDLLLVTDLSPREFIFGKLGGISYNAVAFLLPPLILIAVYGHYHYLATPPREYPGLAGSYNFQAALAVGGCALVVMAFSIVLGIHVALRTMISRFAVINTLGTVFFLSVGTLVCIYLILINGRFEYQWTSFVFFLAAGIGGLWWVLNGERPSAALTLASWICPIGVFYTVTNTLVGRPGSEESADPLMPFVVIAGAFGFTVAAMLVPLVSEFDVALGRTTAGGE
jgi:ABC-type transport system involved in multi-copper enzyme maturation permease subunit